MPRHNGSVITEDLKTKIAGMTPEERHELSAYLIKLELGLILSTGKSFVNEPLRRPELGQGENPGIPPFRFVVGA